MRFPTRNSTEANPSKSSTWFEASLANDQSWIVEWATAVKNKPAPLPAIGNTVEYNTILTAYEKEMCKNQLIKNPGQYETFSVLGLSLIIALGGLVIVTDLTLDIIVGWMRCGPFLYRKEQWDMEESCQLYRYLHAAAGYVEENMRLPSPSVLLSKLYLKNPQNPRAHVGYAKIANEEGAFPG